MKIEIDLSNHATRADMKNAAGVNTSHFVKKSSLTNLKCYIYDWILIN